MQGIIDPPSYTLINKEILAHHISINAFLYTTLTGLRVTQSDAISLLPGICKSSIGLAFHSIKKQNKTKQNKQESKQKTKHAKKQKQQQQLNTSGINQVQNMDSLILFIKKMSWKCCL